MDLGLLSISLCTAVIASLAIDHSPNGAPTDCDCPEIPPYNLTLPPPTRCSKFGDQFRYICIEGYVREAGTSNLIKCEPKDGGGWWRTPSTPLRCIPDPKVPLPTPKLLTSAAPDGGFGFPRRTTVESSKRGSSASASQDVPSTQRTAETSAAPDGGFGFPRRTTVESSKEGRSSSTSPDVPSDQRTENHQKDNRTDENQTSTDQGGITAAFVIIPISLLLIGLGCYCYKKDAGRNRNSLAQRQDDPDVQLRLQEAAERV